MRSALVVALLLAGCASPAAPSTDAPLPLGPPAVDAAAVLGELRAFVDAYPARHPGSPTHAAAREYVRAALDGTGLLLATDAFEGFESVCALREGSNESGYVLVASHFDIVETAGQGAYDDGSGTMMTLALARAFATSPEPARPILFCAWDGEDQGLLGSAHMAEAIVGGAFAVPGEPVAVIDLDMLGIAYPAPAALVADVNDDALARVLAAAATAIGYPEGAIEFRALDGGFNGARAFVEVGYPSAFLISAADRASIAGAPEAGNPFWHSLDTYEGMVLVAGGEDLLEAGFQNVIDLVAWTVAALAR